MQFDWAREVFKKIFGENSIKEGGGGVINGSFSTKDKNIFGFKINVKHNITFIKKNFQTFITFIKNFFPNFDKNVQQTDNEYLT